ncbi:hypothetical protein VQL36_19330 [Chengkuizengella sp. SCS-71B]|uniref:hypothetical protein n=1 Tax=Chengkuizengella sp. SCS-71B TaxID=3115290 RepID=UPI0032C22661
MAKKKQEAMYIKKQILASKQFKDKDILNALLKEDQSYSIKEVKKILDDFYKKEVN